MAALTPERWALATERAAHLAASARQLPGGDLELEPTHLVAVLAACTGTRTVAFGDRGCIATRRLAALMRACRSTATRTIVVMPTAVVLRYGTTHSRGAISLILHPVAADSIVVPLPAAAVPAPVEVHAALPPPPTFPYRPAPHRRGPWWRRVVDALGTHHYG